MGRRTVNINDDIEQDIIELTSLEDNWTAVVNEALLLWVADQEQGMDSS